MDNTIISKTTDYEVIKLLDKHDQQEFSNPAVIGSNWAEYMQKVYLRMKEKSISIDTIKQTVEQIPLNEGMSEVFEFIRRNKDKIQAVIVSGANTLDVKWVVEHNNIGDIFQSYYSNFAHPDEENLIKITANHTHECSFCHDKAQCKKKVLEEIFKQNRKDDSFSHVMYVGDGDNDYCPSQLLDSKDILFPREQFPLYDLLYKQSYSRNLNCNIKPWKSGNKIIESLKEIISVDIY